ncbi:MAG: adenylate/guanylate cyclase domain-containing protein, partial [Bacteroidota bacterium]
LQMKIGEEIFHDLLFGRFNPAREEDRAFLFLDLKSSTAIAEKLGHEQYSYFIQDCFRDLHPAVVASEAEIYQYVGDEAVLTWKRERALSHHHCLRAFFLFQQQLASRDEYYQRRYGIAPIFKAGLNLGKVMTAEVGVVKRDIAYHSDVLNTAARVQELCNEKGALFLVTEEVLGALPKPIPFKSVERGNVLLKGKLGKTRIFEINESEV